MSEEVYVLLAQREALENEIGVAVRLAWPIGAKVNWMKTGRHPAFGVVIMHGVGEHFKVQNAATSAEVWITPYHVRRAYCA